LGENYFNSSIPPEIGRLKSLQILALNNNELRGKISKFLAKEVIGNIPSSIGNLTELVNLNLV
jgi:Leucine-rich repeat (LRR) protein